MELGCFSSYLVQQTGKVVGVIDSGAAVVKDGRAKKGEGLEKPILSCSSTS